MCCHITEFVTKRSWLILLICNHFYSRRMYCLSLNVEQWRKKYEVDSISNSQLQIVREFVLKQMTHIYPQPCYESNTLMIIAIKNITWEGLTNFRILFLKTKKPFEFWRVGSKLFHSMIEEGKKIFFEETVSNFKTGNYINVSCSIRMDFFRC